MRNHPKFTNPDDLNAALIQATDGDLDWVTELIKDGADPNGMPLIMAIQCNASKIVQILIDAGAEINIHFDNTTPLIHAIHSCHVEVVRVLINSGADVNMEDKNLQSPLAIAKGRSRLNASEDEREKIVKMLIEAGAQE